MDEIRRTHIGRLLLQLDKDFTSSAAQIIRDSGFEFVQISHISLVAAVDLGGTPLSQVIERTGSSKQAINKVLSQLEEFNILERSVSKKDSRARIIRFTSLGRSFMKTAIKAVQTVEDEYRGILGDTEFKRLKGRLLTLVEKREIL